MKEQINQINRSIADKRDRLKEKAERYFAAIVLPSDTPAAHRQQPKGGRTTPPISYILYGIAGLSTVAALASDSKILCLGVAAASAFGGYRLSQSTSAGNTAPASDAGMNIGLLKNEIIAKVLDAVKKTTGEWESFMEAKQKEVQATIAASSLNDGQKDEMASKTFLYEVIDISLSEFTSMMNAVATPSDIRQCMAAYQSKLLAAIDTAATKQMSNYNSLAR